MSWIVKIALEVLAWFMRKEREQEDIERIVRQEIERYNKEVMTSADIRKREQETRDRLRERLTTIGGQL
jgi:hypothetical protein